MKDSIRDELKKELIARGFSPSLDSPNDTMGLSESYLNTVEIAALLDIMVARREKIYRSVDVVGPDAAKKSYDDVVLVIEAVKAVIGRLSLV
jgi:hypothetical protein